MEGKKVIKFNLVGTIMVIILIIAIIVGIVVFAVKNNNNQNNKTGGKITSNSNEENISTQSNLVEDDNVNNDLKKKNIIDENKEYIEKIMVNGNEQNVTMKVCKGTFGYTMKYDVNSFYVEKNKDGVDVFNSLYSNTIYMNISLERGNFDELVKSLIPENTNNVNNITEIEINGNRCLKSTQVNNKETVVKYYVFSSEQEYFVICTHCGVGFENIINSIIDVMIDSFEIISED